MAALGRLPGVREGWRRRGLRARLTSAAIAFGIGCALLISSVIVVLFIGTFSRWNLSAVIAGLFVLSVLSLIGGLLCFLREIQLATSHLSIGLLDPGHKVPSSPAVTSTHGRTAALAGLVGRRLVIVRATFRRNITCPR